MKRRGAIAVLSGALALAILGSPSALPRSRMARIGVLRTNEPPDPFLAAFRAGMSALGYVEEQSVVYEIRWAHGNPDRLPALARELAALDPDVILTGGESAIRAAMEAAPSTPIVMGASNDPVRAGLAESLVRPNGMVTGLTIFSRELSAKRLELLREALPGLSRVAVLFNPAYPTAEEDLGVTLQAARSLGLALEPVSVANPAQFAGAFSKLRGSATQALLALADPFFTAHRARLAELALAARLPTMFYWREFVEAGALLSYGPDNADLYRRAAAFVDRILKGAKPGELPIEQPTRFVLAVNLATARTLRIALSQSILLRADEVIE